MKLVVLGVFSALVVGGVLFLPMAERQDASDPAHTGQTCIECHSGFQPGLLAQWKGSAHDRAGTQCEDCHGSDHDAIFRAKGRVPSNFCQGCHADQTLEFKASAHGRALKDALKNARLMAQIPAMQRQGCLA